MNKKFSNFNDVLNFMGGDNGFMEVRGVIMQNILGWLVIGLGAGLLVHFILPSKTEFLTGTLFAGVVGALVGGVIYSALSLGAIASSIDPVSFVVAIVGAIFLLFLINILLSSEGKSETQT